MSTSSTSTTTTTPTKKKKGLSFVKGTPWQNICSHLGAYKIKELREMAKSIGIDTANKSKRQLCSELAQDYDKHTKKTRKCHNDPLLGVPYENVLNEELITYLEGGDPNDDDAGQYYCFTLDEFAGLKKGNKYINPYNRKDIPRAVVDKYNVLLSRPPNPRIKVHHETPIEVAVTATTNINVADKNKLQTTLSRIMDHYQYLPFDKLLILTDDQIRSLRSYLVGLDYQMGTSPELLAKLQQNTYIATDWLLNKAIEQLLSVNRELSELGLALDNFFEEDYDDDDDYVFEEEEDPLEQLAAEYDLPVEIIDEVYQAANHSVEETEDRLSYFREYANLLAESFEIDLHAIDPIYGIINKFWILFEKFGSNDPETDVEATVQAFQQDPEKQFLLIMNDYNTIIMPIQDRWTYSNSLIHKVIEDNRNAEPFFKTIYSKLLKLRDLAGEVNKRISPYERGRNLNYPPVVLEKVYDVCRHNNDFISNDDCLLANGFNSQSTIYSNLPGWYIE